MKRQTNLLLAAAVLLSALGNVLADDITPPPYRGDPRSTSAEWGFNQHSGDLNDPIFPDGSLLVIGDFNTQLNNAFPDGAPHPSGFAFGDISYTGSGWLGGEQTGALAFNVPNWIDQEPIKHLRLQVTWLGNPTSGSPGTSVSGHFVTSGTTPEEAIEIALPRVGMTLPSNNANYFYEDWMIFPNPFWEQVVIQVPFGTMIDQVVIDSISMPEPGSFAITVMGGLGVLAWMARRRRAA
jgi:hypothetical protein